jgi:hypothetical protein
MKRTSNSLFWRDFEGNSETIAGLHPYHQDE